MPRLPDAPELSWTDGAPEDGRHGDIYFQPGGGLSEARAVFLQGCGLPGRWRGRESFTVGELGLGTGLNLAALLELWRREGPPGAWLHLATVEAYLMDRADAARALSAWPELGAAADALLSLWPERARCVQGGVLPGWRATLAVHVGPAEEALAGAAFRADAWFLDGFSPAANPAMWSGEVMRGVARCSAPDAVAATFTVAGAVRRALQGAGFSVAKRPGHGRKRERLEARRVRPLPLAKRPAHDLHGLRGPAFPPRRVAVLGAGIAGACAAAALRVRGAEVTVFDTAPRPATGGSGNPLALVMPRLDRGDTAEARLSLSAYLSAQTLYRGGADGAFRPGVREASVLQRARPGSARDAERLSGIAADPPLPLEWLEAAAGGALLHKGALLVEPAALIASLLGESEAELRLKAPCALEATGNGSVRVDGEAFDAAVVCTAMAAAGLGLPLEARLGQVDWVEGEADAAGEGVSADGYALAGGEVRLWGATFERLAEGEAPGLSEAARAENRARLQALSPWWAGRALRPGVKVRSRAALRATTPDRLPVAGAVPDLAHPNFRRLLEAYGAGAPPPCALPLRPGLFVSAGHGARGFATAPLCAAVVAARLLGGPPPLERAQLEALAPARFALRSARKPG